MSCSLSGWRWRVRGKVSDSIWRVGSPRATQSDPPQRHPCEGESPPRGHWSILNGRKLNHVATELGHRYLDATRLARLAGGGRVDQSWDCASTPRAHGDLGAGNTQELLRC